MSRYEDRTVEELKDLLRAKDLPVSGAKADLIARLRGEEPDPTEPLEEVEPEAPEAPAEPEGPDPLDVAEAAADALVALGDQGNGLILHALTIQRAVSGYRDAARAWAHMTEPPEYTKEG